MRKRKILNIFICAVTVLVLMFALNTSAGASNVRVGLRFGDGAVYSFIARADSGFSVGYASDSVFYNLAEVTDSSQVYVEQGGGHYLISAIAYESLAAAKDTATYMRQLGVYAHSGYINGNYYVLLGAFDDENSANAVIADVKNTTAVDFVYTYLDAKTVMANFNSSCFVFRNESDVFCVGAIDGGTIKVDEKGEYRGFIMADRTYSKAISIINLVNMEDYLASVVGSEMYPSWHIEALKAQAVIARTYALTRTGYRSYGIDVTDDTRTQVYKGVVQETESTYRAAHETAGMVVKYKDKLAETFFYSMSGGKTADVYSAWGGNAGSEYLKSVDDIYEDVSNTKGDIWQVTYTPKEVEEKLAAAGVDIGEVKELTVLDRGDDLRVRKLVITGTKGSHTLTFDKCRNFFNLRSQYYYISGGPKKEKMISVLSANGSTSVNMIGASVLSANGIITAPEKAYVKGANDEAVIEASLSGNDAFVFDGKGFGHGIGMSQHGAQGMAKAGFSYEDIIKFYFTGVSVEQYY